jgi:hypothetical protein
VNCRRKLVLSVFVGLITVACSTSGSNPGSERRSGGADATPIDAAVDAGVTEPRISDLQVLHGVDTPLTAETTGRIVLLNDGLRFAGATQKGISIFDLAGKTLDRFGLPAQNQAPAISAIVAQAGNPELVFMTQGFSSAGEGTLGTLDTGSRQLRPRAVLLETILGNTLVNTDIAGATDAVWTVDQSADPPSILAFAYADLPAAPALWKPSAQRSLPLPKLDVDRNGKDDTLLAANLVLFSPEYAAVTLVVLSALPNVVGGVFFFNPTTGKPLGTLLVPAPAGATTGTIMDAVAVGGRLFVLSDDGNQDAAFKLTRTQGTVSVFELTPGTFLPAGIDATTKVATPMAQFATSTNHPVALQTYGRDVVALTFPLNQPAMLDLINAGAARVERSLSLGVLNKGNREPRRIERSGMTLYIGTDLGLLVAGVPSN